MTGDFPGGNKHHKPMGVLRRCKFDISLYLETEAERFQAANTLLADNLMSAENTSRCSNERL